MLRGFFGNLIFAIIARMLCGNHLKSLLSSLSISMLDFCNSVRISCSSCSSCAHLSLCCFRVSFILSGSVLDTGALSCAGFTHFVLALQELLVDSLQQHTEIFFLEKKATLVSPESLIGKLFLLLLLIVF